MQDFMRNLIEWWPTLQSGLIMTLVVVSISMPASMLVGLLIALIRNGRSRRSAIWRKLAFAYVELMRGLPLILILFILYFGLPAFGWRISTSALVVGIIGLTMNLSAYLSEVFRAAILSVDIGQSEAALSLGMSPTKTFIRIVLPQALRVAVPTLGGYFIALLKDSSLLGFISVEELLRSGITLVSITFRAGEVYLIVGVIYLALSLTASFVIRRLERRLTPGIARGRVTMPLELEREPRSS